MEQPESSSAQEAQTASSLGGRLINVYAAPGEVFEEIRRVPPAAANWLAPVILAIVVGIVFAFVAFSQPAIQHQIREGQQKALQQKVEQGKMTQAQADKAEEMLDRFMGPGILKVFATLGVLIGNVARLLWWALIAWLVGRWALGVQFPYERAMEIAGLSTMIMALGGIVSLLTVTGFGNLYATPSLALLVLPFDPTNGIHRLLAMVNLFDLWTVAVMAVGLAKITGAKTSRAAGWLFGWWLFQTLASAGMAWVWTTVMNAHTK